MFAAGDAATSTQCVGFLGVERLHAELVSLDCSSVLALQCCDSVRCVAQKKGAVRHGVYHIHHQCLRGSTMLLKYTRSQISEDGPRLPMHKVFSLYIYYLNTPP